MPIAAARRFGLEIFVISFAGLLLEISYTRLVSFKLFYYYTYLVMASRCWASARAAFW